MAAYERYRPRERTLGMVMKEVDRTLALFLELRNRENEKKNIDFTENLNEVDDLAEMKCEKAFTVNVQDHVDDRSDFDWLEKTTSLKGLHEYSQHMNSSEDSRSLNNKSMHSSKSTGLLSSACGNRRPNLSTERKSTPCRPLTPTVGSSSLAKKESTRQPAPVSRASSPSTKAMPHVVRSSMPIRGIAQTSTATSRSVTPTPIVKPSAPSDSKSIPRSLTPTPTTKTSLPTTFTKSKSRSATPISTAKSSVPSTSKATSRSTTPECKPNPSLAASSNKSSKMELTGSTTSKNPVPSRGASPTVKSRPSNLSEIPGSLSDGPDLTTLSIKRSKSASRGKPGPAHSSTPLNESSSPRKSRPHSCSPSKGRLPNVGARKTGPALLSKSQGYNTCIEDVNPVLIGTQMVERLVNMRKLAPPRQADNLCEIIASKKSSISKENTGFGRSLSKKSLDMAIRHMDISRSIASDKDSVAGNSSASAPSRARP